MIVSTLLRRRLRSSEEQNGKHIQLWRTTHEAVLGSTRSTRLARCRNRCWRERSDCSWIGWICLLFETRPLMSASFEAPPCAQPSFAFHFWPRKIGALGAKTVLLTCHTLPNLSLSVQKTKVVFRCIGEVRLVDTLQIRVTASPLL